MQISYVNKERRTQILIKQLLKVWEESVRATHLFLSNSEIDEIKTYVPTALNNVEYLVIATNEKNIPVAFMGIEKQTLEMLFISPNERGRGLGKKLLQLGIEEYNVNQLTVNEQNPQALGFYEHMGFKTYKRTAQDEQGDPYPLLYMKL